MRPGSESVRRRVAANDDRSTENPVSEALSPYDAVVLYYRRGLGVQETLDALLSQSHPPASVTLYDNGSLDGIADVIAESYPQVTVVKDDTNLGYAEGMNRAVSSLGARESRYVLLLTHEVLLDSEAAEKLLDAIEASGASVVGPALALPSGEPWSFGGALTKSGRAVHRRHPANGAVRNVDWLDGSVLLVQKAAYNLVGGFDPAYFMYWEDVDLCMRLSQVGPVINCPSAHATQDTNTSPIYFSTRNRIRFWIKQRKAWPLLCSLLGVLGRLLVKDLATPGGKARATSRLLGLADGISVGTRPRRLFTVERSGCPTYLYNPLPRAMAHYTRTLAATLEAGGIDSQILRSASVEIGPESMGRTHAAVMSLADRVATLRLPAGHVIAIWPAFGLFDALAWLPATLKHSVTLIVHDPLPIRRQSGYSRLAQLTFRQIMSRTPRLNVVVHTALAKGDLQTSTGIAAHVVRHPIFPTQTAEPRVGPMKVTVLGQFKPSRDLDALRRLGASPPPNARLRIRGRGWPAIEGWEAVDAFLEESDFEREVAAASCVVVPYQTFYQSGVAVRCLELSTAVVARRHEHLEELFGARWPGFVLDDDDWAAAAVRAAGVAEEQITARCKQVASDVAQDWRDFSTRRSGW